jgi:hypothetical protein
MTLFSHVQDVYIVAGGPSLRGFDFSRLNDVPVIAINRAYEVLPYARVLYWTDGKFFRDHKDALQLHAAPHKAAARDLLYGYGTYEGHPWVNTYELTGFTGLERKSRGLRHGNNSGHAAINLAYNLGARRIGLLGYDMYIDQDRDHWHDGYKTALKDRTLRDKMCPFFQDIARELEAEGVQVLNYSEHSRLRCWPRLPLGMVPL